MATAKQRMCLALALALMPDDRAKSRSSVMRYAVLLERGAVSRRASKLMVRGMPKSQAAWIGAGIGVYRLVYEKPYAIAFLLLGLAYMAYALIRNFLG